MIVAWQQTRELPKRFSEFQESNPQPNTMWILLTLRYIYHTYIALNENHFVKHAVQVGHFVWKNPAYQEFLQVNSLDSYLEFLKSFH